MSQSHSLLKTIKFVVLSLELQKSADIFEALKPKQYFLQPFSHGAITVVYVGTEKVLDLISTVHFRTLVSEISLENILAATFLLCK